MSYPLLILKPGKDKAVRNRHHWIFSGAIRSLDDCNDGDLVEVKNSLGEHLGYAYVNHHTSITGRMISWGKADPITTTERYIDAAIEMRKQRFAHADTNAYRLINSEGDMLPGLIVDQYDTGLVVQSGTAGTDKLLPHIIEILKTKLHPSFIYERSDAPGRREEKLGMKDSLLFGTMPEEIKIKENGLRFLVDISRGQKTGFFLDQREMRSAVRSLAKDKRVLNCFGYTGGFAIAALAGGAKEATTVDISEEATQLAEKNFALNTFEKKTYRAVTADVFTYLREKPLDFDLIILDPPAFAKKKNDIVSACRGYKEINRVAIEKMPQGSILITSSCSYHIDPALFQTVVFQAALDAGRQVKIIDRHHMAPDHPLNIYHPEGEYLKSLVLWVE